MRIPRLMVMASMLAGFCLSGPMAAAHHSTAGIYNEDTVVEISGRVKEWRFVNPHPSLIVEVDSLAIRTTVSIGVAVFPDHDTDDLNVLVRMADEALYRAKRQGRDRVVPFVP